MVINMIKKRIIFIILHYIVDEVTIKSVEHIKRNMDIDDYQIIVVDNCSPNDSYDILLKKFEADEYVTLIRNSENLGFTGGNNKGIKYATEHYEFEFMVVLNNDAFLLETAFYYKLKMYYNNYHFAVAGPRIIDPYGRNSNPAAEELPTMEIIEERISYSKKIIKYKNCHLLNWYCFYEKYRSRLERMNKIFRNKEKCYKVIMGKY